VIKGIYFALLIRLIHGLCGVNWWQASWRGSLIYLSYLIASPIIVLPLYYLSNLLGLIV